MSGDILEPGVLIRPQMGADLAAELLRRLYGLTATNCKELNSYDDRNFYFTGVAAVAAVAAVQDETAGGDSAAVANPHLAEVWQHGYVLKVTNSQDSKHEAFLEAQNLMILHLDKELPVPGPVPNRMGKLHSLELVGKSHHVVRLMRFIPGKIMYDVPVWTADLFYQCGSFVARMDKILSDFSHVAYEARNSIWFLSSVPALKDFIDAVKDEERKKLAIEIIDEFIKTVKPVETILERSIIHGDFNEQNILVKEKAGTGGDGDAEYDVHGVLDFGDSQYNPLLYELGITIMYMMTQCKTMSPSLAGGHVTAGYIKHRDLPEKERALLRICVAARYAQSLVMGAYSYQQDPGNEYLLITSKTGWEILSNYWRTPQRELYQEWDSIIASYSPHLPRYLSSSL